MLGSQVLLALQQLTDLSRKEHSLQVFLDSATQMLCETTDFTGVAIELYHPSAQEISVLASTDTQPLDEQKISLRRADSSIALSERVLSEKKTQIQRSDSQNFGNSEPKFPFHPENYANIQTLIKVPLLVNQSVIGILNFAHRDRLDEDLQQLSLWAESLASYLGSLILSFQLDAQRDSYVRRLEMLGQALEGFAYDWDLTSGEVERIPPISAVFNVPDSLDPARMDSWLQQVYAEDREDIKDFYESIWKQEGDFSLSYRIGDSSYSVETVSDQGTVIRNSDQVPIRVIGRVIRQAETEAMASSAAFPLGGIPKFAPMADHQRSQTMLDHIKTVIFNTDLDGRWVYLNPAWTALTGYSIEESMGEAFIDWVASEDRQSTLDAFQSLLDGQTDFYSQEVRLNTKLGSERWLAMEIQATLSDQGQLIGTYGSFHDISEYKDTEAQLLQNALYDSLTGLPNRVLFLERLRHTYQAYRRNHENLFTVLFLDVDSFKNINDTYGHLVGDKVLVEVANRLVACLRPGDTTARLGGDEFTILLPQINAREDVSEIATRILVSLRTPFLVDDLEIQASATIGIAVCGHPYEQPEDLLRNADMALYKAKSSQKGTFGIFKPSMHSGAAAELQIESDLRRALESQEFRVDYQPIFDLKSEAMVGLEAVMRWNHPTDGLVESDKSFEVAEKSGLIVPLGWKLLETACQQLLKWHLTFDMPQITMAIPVSFAQMRSPEFMAKVHSVLDFTGIEPRCLQFYLIGVMDSLDDVALRSPLDTLKSLGISLSLARVLNLEPGTELATYGGDLIQSLILDSALVLNMGEDNNLDLLRIALAMGHKFNYRIQATGIDSAQKLAQLRAFRCELGQGAYFGEPMTAEDIDARWLEFVTPADELSSSLQSPALVLNSDTQQSQLSLFGRQAWSIGRSNDSAIVLPDRWVSRHHAELQCMYDGEVYFVDLGSGNGSYVNGERVTMPLLLTKGDRLTVGQTDIDFVASHASISPEDIQLNTGLSSPKTVLMMQSSKLQGEVWRESLTSQGISLIWLQPNVDLVQLLEQRAKTGQPLPDLLLLDMTVIKPNPYSFCRWCGQEYSDLNIILTSGSRGHVPPSERQWAINQGARDLLAAFPERNIFGNMVDVVSKVRIVLSAMDIEPTDQSSLSEVLMSLKTSMNRATLH